ncbi:MAG: hypothetical protein QM765_32040 [Myxococcales bacterium]
MDLLNRYRALWALPLVLASCAYASDYVVPKDGRARVIWQGGEPRAVVPEKSGACELATREASANYNPPEAVQRCMADEGCGPVHYEPSIYIDGHPPLLHPPLFGLHDHHGPHIVPVGPSVPLHPGDPVPGPHQATPAPPKGSSGGGKSSSGSSLGSLGDVKELAVVAAVIAILTMPAVAIALASTRPENESGAAKAVDEVNAYNDLVRSPGSACSPYALPQLPVMPQVQDSPAAVVPDPLPANVPPPPPAPEGQR